MRLEVRHANSDLLLGLTNTERTASSQFATPEPIGDRTHSWSMRGVPLGMHRMNPEHLNPDPSTLSAAVDVLLREEPDDEEDDEEKHDRDEENDDPDEGYSE
jgi:hypothetical protein